MNTGEVRWYRGVMIHPKNRHGMFYARVDVPGGGEGVAADTLLGIKEAIRTVQQRYRR